MNAIRALVHIILKRQCDRNEIFLNKIWPQGCIDVLANMTKELGVIDHRYDTAFGIARGHQFSSTVDTSSNHGQTAKPAAGEHRRRCLPLEKAVLRYLDQKTLRGA